MAPKIHVAAMARMTGKSAKMGSPATLTGLRSCEKTTMVVSCMSPKLQQAETPANPAPYNPSPMAAMTGAMVTGEMYRSKMGMHPEYPINS
eukprot:scaffold490_cov186-Amphora_coffeaeformis.AAC.4